MALVAGRNRVPMPATGKTALRIGRMVTLLSLLIMTYHRFYHSAMSSLSRLRLPASVVLSLTLVWPVWPTDVQAQPMGLPSMGAASAADLSPGTEREIGELI